MKKKIEKDAFQLLDELRRAQGRTIDDASYAIGISRPTYTRRLAHPEEVRVGEIRAFCHYLKIDGFRLDEVVEAITRGVRR